MKNLISTNNYSFSQLLLKKIKVHLSITLFAVISFNMFAQNTSLISACSDFVPGSTAPWSYILVATTVADSVVSQGSQTFTMNVTDTANGASVRVAKTTANGNWFFGNPVQLSLGANSVTVPAVTFDRTVKFQFSSGDVEFDDLNLNGVSSNCVVPLPPSTSSLISACDDFVAGTNASWPHILVATIIADGAPSQSAQTFTMNVTDTANGANVRVAKTTANGNWYIGNPVQLSLGANSVTVPAVTFDRSVKFQFSSGDVEFDALSLNGEDSECVCVTSSFTDVVEACDTYTWIDGNTYTSSNNTATDTLINAAGCDSVVSLDLTITTVNSAVDVIDSLTLQSQSVDPGTTYQWLDCNDNFAPIFGENNAIFTTYNSGYYAVEITLNNCSVISDCFSIISTTSINDLDTRYGVQIFPNPTTNSFTISLENIDNVDVIIVDVQGKVLLKQSGIFDRSHIDLSQFDAGIYFLKIINLEGSREIRIAKQ